MNLRSLAPILMALLTAAAPGAPTRVRIIAPSRPLIDTYQTITIVARAEDGSVDRHFTGDAWLWTDGSYLRPYHVYFRPEDRGVIRTPAMIELPALIRLEAYQTDGMIQAWSNPVLPRKGETDDPVFAGVLPVDADSSGPPLLWGRLDDCAEPGLDFCVRTDASPAPDEVTVLEGFKTVMEGQTWIVIPDPDLEAGRRESIIANLRAATDLKQLYAALAEHGSELAVIRAPARTEPGILDQVSGLLTAASQPPAAVLALAPFTKPGRNLLERHDLARLLADYGPDDRLPSIIPDLDSNLAVWAHDAEPGSIWRSLKRGLVYGSRGSRVLMLYPETPGERITVLVAGEGPREEVSIRCRHGKDVTPLLSKSDDDFHLMVRFNDPGAPCFIEVYEPGERPSLTVAGPLPRFSSSREPAP